MQIYRAKTVVWWIFLDYLLSGMEIVQKQYLYYYFGSHQCKLKTHNDDTTTESYPLD